MFNQIVETFIDLNKYALVDLYQSLNQPHISPGAGLVAEPSTAHMMIVRGSSNKAFEIFIGLFFSETDQRVIYHIPAFQGEFVEEKLSQAEAFLGQMGFLMDNCHFNSASPDEKNEMKRTLPFLYASMEHYYQALRPGEIEAKKSKAEVVIKRDSEADLHRLFLERYIAIMGML